jgi:hypothetical protein
VPNNAWKLIDSAPVSLAQQEQTKLAESPKNYWGPVPLAFNDAQASSTTHQAQVAFIAHGMAAYKGQLAEKGTVADTGVGIAAFAAGLVRSAASAFVGHGLFAGTAARVLGAIASFTGSATFASLASKIQSAAVAHAGAATFQSAGDLAEAALASFTGTATLVAAAGVVHSAAVDFSGAAEEQIGTPPVPLKPNETGGYGFEKRDIVRRPRRRYRHHAAEIAFSGSARVSARATVIAGEVRLPFFEAPTPSELPVIPQLVVPLEPAVVGQITPHWTDEEMAIALLMFEEAA